MHCTVCWLHITLYQKITYLGLVCILAQHAVDGIFVRKMRDMFR